MNYDGELYDYIYPHVKNKLVFDVGANVGEVTKKLINADAKVISVEPQKKLTKNENFKGVHAIENICLSNEIGKTMFYTNNRATTTATCLNEWMDLHPKANWKGETVKTTTLDFLIEKYGAPEYLKIDVEGYENKVLEGLHHKINYISFEFTSGFCKNFIECLDSIDRLGYKKLTTFVKRKIKAEVNGKRRTIKSFKEVCEFSTSGLCLAYFMQLSPGVQGDLLVEA